jgi:hypothetical protein
MVWRNREWPVPHPHGRSFRWNAVGLIDPRVSLAVLTLCLLGVNNSDGHADKEGSSSVKGDHR